MPELLAVLSPSKWGLRQETGFAPNACSTITIVAETNSRAGFKECKPATHVEDVRYMTLGVELFPGHWLRFAACLQPANPLAPCSGQRHATLH